ncbi:MAG: aminotransferase class I/II-fold pyridoxal phosphate-dependent enzyme, partial [Planctomycetia bacterium]|nr:aminotransferase class I/II-fold pyridoxal phosphate-dependent enzyme [Planctomycetia bacterium]
MGKSTLLPADINTEVAAPRQFSGPPVCSDQSLQQKPLQEAGGSIGDRVRPGAHTRLAILRVVIEELQRVVPAKDRRPLSMHSSLSDAGIDAERFLDAISRIEGRYQMRFHDDWLRDMRTVGELVACISKQMFDAADRAAELAPVQQRAVKRSPAASPQTTRVESATTRRSRTRLEDGNAFPECEMLENRLEGLQAAGLENPFHHANESVQGRTAKVSGRDVVSFTSFDYLGLAGHPEVKQSAKDAIDRFGCSASASRMVGGNNTTLDELDKALADFIGTERAVVFPCGYGTNASVFNHLFGEGDLILYDELAHNSIMQGAGASKAGKRSFRHNDCTQLDGLLRDLRPQYRRVV